MAVCRKATVISLVALLLRLAVGTASSAQVDLLAEFPDADDACNAEDGLCDLGLSLRQLRGERRSGAAQQAQEVASDAPALDEAPEAMHGGTPSPPPLEVEYDPESLASCVASNMHCEDYKIYHDLSGGQGQDECGRDPLCRMEEAGDIWNCYPAEETCVTPLLVSIDEDDEEEDGEGDATLQDADAQNAAAQYAAAQEAVDDLANMSLESESLSDRSRSCRGRCDKYQSWQPCQCTGECIRHANCCIDYLPLCRMPTYVPPTYAPPSPSYGRPTGPTKTLYHTTSAWAARQIVQSGFQPGHSGWCGGAIYFIDHPYLPKSKYAKTTKSGAILEARVDMGRMAHMDRRCKGWGGTGVRAAKRAHFQTLTFNPGDGAEYILWDPHRVQTVRIYKYM